MTGTGYKLRFCGVRGTVPTPESDMLRYGGNTSCLSVDLGNDGHLILDCGTGIRMLGNEVSRRPGAHRYHIFFSHYHLDHIMGLPFFKPLYDPASHITFYGFDSKDGTVADVLYRYMAPPYFPVTLRDVPSRVEFVTIDGNSARIGSLNVSSLRLNHPDGCQSYRLEVGNRRTVYATDHEHGQRETDLALIRFSEGAEHLIYDATYQEAEYERLRRGWGHSTWYAAVQAALAARAKNLVLFHHHPEHTDDDLEKILRLARDEMPSTTLATEGLEIPI